MTMMFGILQPLGVVVVKPLYFSLYVFIQQKNWYYVDLANADQTRWFIFDFKTSSWKTADL